MQATDRYGPVAGGRSNVFVILLTVSTLVIGPLFGVVVDLIYALLIALMIDKLQLTPPRILIIAVGVGFGLLLLVTSPSASDPYFSYFFLRIPLLLLVFIAVPRGNTGPDPKLIWLLFVVYVAGILYQYFALPGSELLELLHADRIVEIDLAYRASGLFSGFFSAATIIGSLGVILILRSGVTGTVVASSMLLVVAFCSGRSVIIYLLAAILVKFIKTPRIALASAFGVIVLLIFIISMGERFSSNANLSDSFVLFLQILSILSGNVSGTSTEALMVEQYYLPDDMKTLLLGNNERPFTLLGVKSDSGYVQLIFGAGVLGSLVYFALLAGMLFRRLDVAGTTLLGAALIVSIKGNVFNAIGVLDIILLCCVPYGVKQLIHCPRAEPSGGGDAPNGTFSTCKETDCTLTRANLNAESRICGEPMIRSSGFEKAHRCESKL